jgi:apolipoprotein N-acyltransferase
VRDRVLWPDRSEAKAALASAALFAVAFPPFLLVLPAFLCLVPLALHVVRQADGSGTARSSARVGFWFGLIGYGCNLYWIAIALSLYTKLAILGYFASLLVLAPVTAAAAASLYAVRRLTRLPVALLLPVVWSASEVVLNRMSDLAFPWLPLGLAVSHVPVLAQIAELSGVRTISFWMAGTAGLCVDAWLMRESRQAVVRRMAAVAAVALLVLLYGVARMRSIETRPLAPIAIVQPNIPQLDKWQEENRGRIVGIIADLTHQTMARGDAELVVLPEVAFPGFLIEHQDWQDTIRSLTAGSRTPMIFGVLDLIWRGPEDYEYYNAAMLADSLGRFGTQPAYHKAKLVPIVERVPFINPRWFSRFRYFGALGRGEEQVVYRLPFGGAGVLICYESIFPDISREYRRRGADVLLNITNDAWFGRSLAPYQHEAHLALRAIENRVSVVRSANTGISGYVDPLGRISGRTGLFEPASRTYKAETTSIITLYTRVGDWIGVLSLIATAVGAIMYASRRRRNA